MRVISGTARGTKLYSPSSAETRPITDRAKEALFSILSARIPHCRFLDLFAGTGGVGIEALSRGAESATFIELSEVIFADLRRNVERTHLQKGADMRRGDAFVFLQKETRAYDVVFVAPPQWKDLCQRALDMLCDNLRLLAEDGVVVAQHDPAEEVVVRADTLEKYDVRVYGGVQLDFYKRPE